MSLLLVPFFVPLLFFLPGYLFSRTFLHDPNALSAGERLFVAVAASVCLTTGVALTLAEFGAFSLWNLLAWVLGACALVWILARRKFSAWSLRGAKPDGFFFAILALAIFLFAHPAEYILGNSDAGTYINTGASIAQTGGIAIHDAQVAQLDPDASKTFYWQLTNPYMLYTQVRLPGFFIADQTRGVVLPQFLHLYPAWLALWDALLGVPLGLFATPLIALLGSIALYFLAREVFGQQVARLAFFLLVVMVPQFWFARYPVAEAFTQFLVLTGMFALTKLMRQDLKGSSMGASQNLAGLGLVAGVAFGQLFLVRSDSILFLVPLGLYFVATIFWRKWQREHWMLFGAFGIVFAQAVAHMLVFAPNYLYYQYTHALKLNSIDKIFRFDFPDAQAVLARGEYWIFVLGALLLGLAALFVADRLFQNARARWGHAFGARFMCSEKILRAGLAGLLVILIAAFYLVLPRAETLYAYVGGLTPTRSEANLLKLGWYLSPIGIALATLGAALVVLRDLNARNLVFFGTAALFAVFYLDELYSNPHYIYTTRHYIPLVLPLFVLCAARALMWLWGRGEAFARAPFEGETRSANASPLRYVAASAFALWMLYNLYAMGLVDASRAEGIALRVPFVVQPVSLAGVRIEPFEKSIVGMNELGGAYAQLEKFAEQIPPNAVVIFSAGRDEPAALATPLKYIFGRDAFVTVFNNPPGDKVAAMLDAWRAQGRDVILAFGTNGGKLQLPNYELERVGDASLDVPQLAFSYEFMPRTTWRVNLNYALYRAVPRRAPDTYPFALNFGGADFPYLVSGFLERAPEAHTRWIGGILAENKKLLDAKTLSGVVRVPVADDSSANLVLTLRARAPRDGAQLQIRQGKHVLGQVTLSQSMSTYTIALKAVKLDAGSEGYWLELVSDATLDGAGRALGAELESLRVERQK